MLLIMQSQQVPQLLFVYLHRCQGNVLLQACESDTQLLVRGHITQLWTVIGHVGVRTTCRLLWCSAYIMQEPTDFGARPLVMMSYGWDICPCLTLKPNKYKNLETTTYVNPTRHCTVYLDWHGYNTKNSNFMCIALISLQYFS